MNPGILEPFSTYGTRSGHGWALQKNIGCGSIPWSQRDSCHGWRTDIPEYLLLFEILFQASDLSFTQTIPRPIYRISSK
jgi:hypothetical protein